MPDAPPRPVPDEEVVKTLAFGLRHEGRLRAWDADAAMARITAIQLVKLPRASGYQVFKAPSASAPSTTEHIAPGSPPLKS